MAAASLPGHGDAGSHGFFTSPMHSPDQRLADLGIVLPPPPPGVGAYVPWLRSGNVVFTSGQLPWEGDHLAFTGKVGAGLTEAEGYLAARLCAINALAQLREAAGNLGRVRQILRLDGYVHAAPGFRGHPQVLNGASELLNTVFGDRGRHTRVALGITEMPLDAAVQICLYAEIEA